MCAILYGAESRFHVCTQVHGVAECTKQGRASAAVRVVLCGVRTAFVIAPNISSPSLPHCLICQSLTTVASFPLSPLFFSFSNPPSSFFSFLSSHSVALSSWLSISVFSSPSSPHSSVLHFFNLFLSSSFFTPSPFFLLSVSFPLFLHAASMFLCVNSWDAFVEGFHSDGPFEQVVIHVCSL